MVQKNPRHAVLTRKHAGTEIVRQVLKKVEREAKKVQNERLQLRMGACRYDMTW